MGGIVSFIMELKIPFDEDYNLAQMLLNLLGTRSLLTCFIPSGHD
jgi:hypothetical protein